MRTPHRLVAAAAFLLAGCSSSDNPAQPNPGGSNVVITNNQFTPSTITVTVGTTVTWQWNSSGVSHNVTFADGPTSGTKSSGSYPRTFQAAGSYPYVCTIHEGQGMTGTVTVTAASSGAGGNQTGSGGSGMGDGGGGAYP
jgi:plastocyanin